MAFDVTQGLRGGRGTPPRNILSGYVSRSATPPLFYGDDMSVVLPSLSANHNQVFTSWPKLHGSVLPQQGAAVLVAADEAGRSYVIWWAGDAEFPFEPVLDARPVSGDKGGNEALGSLVAALADLGLVVDGTT